MTTGNNYHQNTLALARPAQQNLENRISEPLNELIEDMKQEIKQDPRRRLDKIKIVAHHTNISLMIDRDPNLCAGTQKQAQITMRLLPETLNSLVIFGVEFLC